jgi:hypothetical protein
MADRIRLDIEPPINGWAKVRLTGPEVLVEFVASYTPSDSIGELARAAKSLLAGLPEQVVVWNTEPIEYEFRFVMTGGRTSLEVWQFPDGRTRRCPAAPIGVVEGATIDVVRAVWRGLRRLQGAISSAPFEAAWGHPFPAETVEQVGRGTSRGSIGAMERFTSTDQPRD